MIIVNGYQPLTIITKRSILDVAAVLDPPLVVIKYNKLGSETTTVSFFLRMGVNMGVNSSFLRCYMGVNSSFLLYYT